MKMISRVLMTAVAVAALAAPAMAADKLIVQNTTNGTAFKVDDAGKVTVRNAGDTADVLTIDNTGMVSLPIASGTGRGASFKNPSVLNNFGMVGFAADQSVANAGMAFQVIPKGTGFNAAIKAQLSIFNTDYNADPVNYESMVVKSGGTLYSINSVKGGTGVIRPIAFQINGATKLTIDATTGSIIIPLVTYTSNANATSAGLTAGALYTDGAGNVKVVY